MRTFLVTGGAGFIGSHIVDALTEQGCDVTVIDNLSTGHLSNLEHVKDRITFIRGDITDRELLMREARGCEVIFHQAAVVSVPQTVEQPVDSAMINHMGTLFVLEAAKKSQVKRVVLASSCAVYGDDPELPKRENMKAKPLSPYAVQKFSGELNARVYNDLYGLETVCLRYFNVFGPRQDPGSPYSGVISIFMAKAANNEVPIIYGDGNQYRDFVFVKDVVKANILSAGKDNACGKEINVGTGRFVKINNLWDMVGQMAGTGIKPKYMPARPGDIIQSVADIGRAEKAMGYGPEYSFEKGLEITFNWYKEVL
jgi:nucleoside-diphosphate-sugar epimerase